MRKGKYLVIFGLFFIFLVIIGTLKNDLYSNQDSNSVEELDLNKKASTRVTNYVITMQVSGKDLITQINITYLVSSGTKYNGFKRFIYPYFTFAFIDENTINIYDDSGTTMNWAYFISSTEFPDQYYELRYYMSGFSGTKTISLNFIMRNWIIESWLFSRIELRNFGKFGIPIDRLECNLIFPESFNPHLVVLEESKDSELLQKVGNKYVYTITQTDARVSDDLILTFMPKNTFILPILLAILLIPLIVIVFQTRLYKKRYLEDDTPPKYTKILKYTAAEIAYITHEDYDKRSRMAKLIQATLIDLYVKGKINFTKDNSSLKVIVTNPTDKKLDSFSKRVLDIFHYSNDKKLEELLEEKYQDFIQLEDLIPYSLSEKKVLKNNGGVMKKLTLTLIFELVIFFTLITLNTYLAVGDLLWLIMQFSVLIIVTFLYFREWRKGKYILTVEGKRFQTFINEVIQDLKIELESMFFNESSIEMIQIAYQSVIGYIAASEISSIKSWIEGLCQEYRSKNPKRTNEEKNSLLLMEYQGDIFSTIVDQMYYFKPPVPEYGGWGGCAGGGCGGGGCGGGGCGGGGCGG